MLKSNLTTYKQKNKKIIAVSVLIIGIVIGSISTPSVMAFTFGSEGVVTRWIKVGNIVRLRNETNDVSVGASSTLFVKTSNNRVGIGTTVPGQALDVKGTVRISGDATHYAELRQDIGNGMPLSFSFSKPSGEYGSYLDIQQSHQYYGFLMHGTTGIGGGVSSWGGQGLDASGNFGISLATTSKDMVFYGGNFGSEIMRLKGTGSIGIGTASPSSIFHIYGAAPSLIVQANASSGVNANPSIFLNTIQGGVGFKFYFDGAATGSTYFDNYYTGGSMIFRTQVSSTTPITAMTIKNNANISMGNKLSVAGSLASGSVQTEDILSLTRGDAGPSWPEMVSFKLGRHTAGTLAPRSRLDINLKSTADSNFTADVNVMTLTDAGNVGIGTTTPSNKLHVYSTSGRVAVFGSVEASTPTATPVNVSFGSTFGNSVPGSVNNLKWDLFTSSSSGSRYGIGMSSGLMEFQSGPGGGLGFFVNQGTEAMRIISGGNVGIGTTTPETKLHIIQTAASSTRETIIKANVSDAGNDTFMVSNGTSGDNIFWPAFAGYGSSLTRSGLAFRGLLPVSADASNSSDTGVIDFEVNRTDNASDPLNGNLTVLQNRMAFRFGTIGNSYMAIMPSGNVGIGTTTPSERLEINGGVRLNTVTAKPTCDTTHRGTMWFTQSSAGTKDILEVCAKDAADAYNWRTLY